MRSKFIFHKTIMLTVFWIIHYHYNSTTMIINFILPSFISPKLYRNINTFPNRIVFNTSGKCICIKGKQTVIFSATLVNQDVFLTNIHGFKFLVISENDPKLVTTKGITCK